MAESPGVPEQAVEELKRDLEAIRLPSSAPPPKERCQSIFLFFSFDLVGSTAFKANHNNWAKIAEWFYRNTLVLGSNQLDASLWKYAGDEVLFYREVFDPEVLEEAAKKAQTVLVTVTKGLHEEYKETRGKLSIKGILWMSPILVEVERESEAGPVESICKASDTMLKLGPSGEESGSGVYTDFLGPNIDIGFRLAEFAKKQQIVVSANLAFFILKRSQTQIETAKHYLLVTYQTLKGVLGGDYYPCIWYRPQGKSLSTDFDYDDEFKDPIIKKALEEHQNPNGPARVLEGLDGMYRKREHADHSHLLMPSVIEEVMKTAQSLRGVLKEPPTPPTPIVPAVGD